MKNFDITEFNGILGEWWLPEKPSNKIHGVLSIADNGKIEMRSIEQFEDTEFDFCGNYPAIDGFLSKGQKVTLINAFRYFSEHMPGYEEDHYEPQAIVIGQHFDVWDFSVDAIEADFDRVSDWFNVNPFQIITPEDKSAFTISCVIQHLPTFQIGDKKISLGYNQQMSKQKYTMSLQYFVRAEIAFNKQIKILNAIDELRNLANFFTLCMGTKCNFKNISFTVDEEENNYLLFNASKTEDEAKQNLPPFLISYADIDSLFVQCVKEWYCKKEDITPVIDYFVEAHDTTLHHSSVMTFLKLAQALESYSRKTWKETAEPQADYEARVARILGKFDEKDPDYKILFDMLNRTGANEPSNNKRFKTIIQRTKGYLGIESCDSIKKLSYHIVATRNYYTHFNESLKNDIYSAPELYHVNSLLREMLRILLMQSLNIPNEKIQKAVSLNGDIRRASRVLKLV